LKRKLFSLALVLALGLSILSGCGRSTLPEGSFTETPQASDTGGGEAAPIRRLTVGTTAAIEQAVSGEYNYDMLSSGTSQLPLVRQDAEGEYHPLLAAFETEDAVTWTYTVRDGMCWSDGVPVTAEDILFTLQYEDQNGGANLTDQTDSEGKTTKAKYTGYALSEDKRSISLTLAAANVRELSNMTSFRVLPRHIYEGKETLTEAERRVGCGPYVLERFNRDAGTLVFTPNPYYPAAPNAAELVYQLFDNEDTMYMALQNGDIDMVWAYSTGVSGTYQEVLAASDSVDLISVSAANLPAVLAFNNTKGPFADENLRKAVVCALDYETFRTYVGSARADIPRAGVVPPAAVGYHETPPLAQDLPAAEGYMAAAGYTRNADGFFADGTGAVFGFTLTCRADRDNQVGCAEIIKTQLEDFGISVTLEALDSDSYNAKTSNKFSENNVTMEAAVCGYTAAGVGMMNGLATIYVDGTHPVQGGCQVFDRAFQAIQAELSAAAGLEEYYAAAAKMQEYYAEHVPLAALCWDSMTYAVSSRFENVTVDGVFGLNNAENWFSITEK